MIATSCTYLVILIQFDDVDPSWMRNSTVTLLSC